MNKQIVPVLFALFALVLFLPSLSSAAWHTYTVGDENSDCADCDYTTLEAAVADLACDMTDGDDCEWAVGGVGAPGNIKIVLYAMDESDNTCVRIDDNAWASSYFYYLVIEGDLPTGTEEYEYDTNKYVLGPTLVGTNMYTRRALNVELPFTRIHRIQIAPNQHYTSTHAIHLEPNQDLGDSLYCNSTTAAGCYLYLDNSIIVDEDEYWESSEHIMVYGDPNGGAIIVRNNLIQDCEDSSDKGIDVYPSGGTGGSSWLYYNTIVNCNMGINGSSNSGDPDVVAKNNIVDDGGGTMNTCYNNNYTSTSDYNFCSNSSDDTGGSNDVSPSCVTFETSDFRIKYDSGSGCLNMAESNDGVNDCAGIKNDTFGPDTDIELEDRDDTWPECGMNEI